MAKKLLYFILTISFASPLVSQWKLAKEVALSKRPHSYASDSDGNIFIGYKDGSLVKYDNQGNELLNYSLSNQSPITFIEPQFQLKTFLFYFDNQVITILDRFNTVPKNYPITGLTDGLVSIACSSPDGSFWTAENNPVILKRINPNQLNTIVELQPDLGSEIRYMKSYQNLLIIADENGLYAFDQFGNQLYNIEMKFNGMSLTNDLIYCLTKVSLLTIDSSKGEILGEKNLPVAGANGFLYAKPYFVFIKDDQLLFYQTTN